MPASKEIFEKYRNPIFVETGSHLGDGIQQALDAGFGMIYSIELNPDFYQLCFDRFGDVDNICLLLGDTNILLKEVLKVINDPATFWLDAHYYNDDSPLIHELKVIGEHHIKNHTIMIDDLRCWSKEVNGFDTEILKEEILKINPKYRFAIEDGFVSGDILTAKI